MKKNSAHVATLSIFSILAICFASKLLEAMSPALQSIGAALSIPYTSVTMLMTVPTLISIPVSLGVGFVAGRVFKYRTVVSVGLILVAVGGMCPFFLKWPAVLFSMGLFGCGLGIIIPTIMSLIFALVEPSKQGTMMGLNNTVSGFSGMIFSSLSGVLVVKSYNYPFLINGVAIIVLILVLLFLPEPEKKELPPKDMMKNDATAIDAEPIKGDRKIFWLSIVMLFFFSFFNFPCMGNISFIFNDIGLSAALAGVTVSCLTAGTMVSGIVFGIFFKKMGTKSIALGFIIGCIGQLLLATSQIFPLFAIAMFCEGFGALGIAFAGLSMIAGNVVPRRKSAIAMSIVMTGVNLGIFAEPYVMTAITNALHITSMRFAHWVGLVAFIVLAVISLFIKKGATHIEGDLPEMAK